MFSLVVFAAISMLLMFAARVPIVANSINEFLGLPQTAKPDTPDRTTHLIFLLFCYSSPLVLAMWVSLLNSIYLRWKKYQNLSNDRDEADSPFA